MDAEPDHIGKGFDAMVLAGLDREARRSGQLRADAVDQKIHGSGGKNGKVVVCVLVLDQDQSSSDARLF